MRRELPSLGDYWRMVRRSGFRRAWTYFWDNHFFDLFHGTNTAHWRPRDSFSKALPNGEHAYHYEASYTSAIEMAIRRVASRVDLARYDFYDLGCGKGKALLIASRFPFGKICGIEYDPRLAEIARHNLHIKGMSASIIECDAGSFSGYGRRAVVYLYNPFDEVILKSVTEHLEQLDDVIVIYTNAVHAEVFAYWKRIDSVTRRLPQQSSNIYGHPT